MAFVNEKIPDDAIEKYGFSEKCKNSDSCYWTYDKEKNIYLRGGGQGNPAFGIDIRWIFNLEINNIKFKIKLKRGKGSMKYSEVPYIVMWESVDNISPQDLHGYKEEEVINILKEALNIWGEDGRDNKFAHNLIVKYDF